MVAYVFRDGVIIQNRKLADPQKIGEAIDEARRKTPIDGDVREVLVKAARARRHALHNHLEWDDAIAGHRYRLEQINDLIRITCVIDEGGEPRPAFISVVSNGSHRAFYSPAEIENSQKLQTAALLAAERDLESFERRHRWLADICSAVAALRGEVRARREQRVSSSIEAA
jgi:hypothetical protein